MFKSVWKCLLAIVLAATPLLAAQNAVLVPLLPDDDGQQVTFTKESFGQLLATNKAKMPVLRARLSGIVESTSLNNEVAVTEAIHYLLNSSPMGAMLPPGGTTYLEGAPPSGGMLTYGGWPYQVGQTTVARSTYGEIGLALLSAYTHHPNPGLLGAIRQMAAALSADFTGNGPLAGTHKPFMPDIVFLAQFQASGLKDTGDATNYLTVAQNWFAVLTSARPVAADEVDRIVAARTLQGVKELSGYDIAWLYNAADLVGNTSYRDAAAARLIALSGSWEVNGTGTTDAQAQSSTGNMLSRAALVAAAIGNGAWPAFLAGTQQTIAGSMNGYDSNGSFLPSGNIQSNSWIILALEGQTWWHMNVVKGARYLLETQLTGGAWYSYPLFGGTEIYPNEVATALLALANTAFVLEITNIKDRDGQVALSGIPVQLQNAAGDTTLKTSNAGSVSFYAVLDTSLTVSFPMNDSRQTAIQGYLVTADDASYILSNAVLTTPFLGNSQALQAANLGKNPAFTNTDVNSQIAAEILRFAVDLDPQYGPLYFDLSFIYGTSYKDTLRVNYDHSGAISLITAKNMLLRGDISNNMASMGGLPIVMTMLASASKVESPYRLGLDNFTVKSGSLSLPVKVAGIGSLESGPRSFQYELSYDPSLVSFAGLTLSPAAAGFMYAVNSNEEGVLKIAMASGTPLHADGVIAFLEFNRIESDRAPTFELENVMVGEKNADVERTDYALNQTTSAAPKAFSLLQNSPNPFNPSTTINYTVPDGPEKFKVNLSVFNMRGQLVNSLVDKFQAAGSYAVHWDGRDMSGNNVASGVYFYRIQAGEYSQVRKMIILK